ncbi:hypothetical protein PR048_019969 [Dryococelus australis]|uniref:Uncharacterized protein n=1 Tax=Dryococelus australis TaxID=614101 RepID=A0ABQ9H4Y9_9NEOP|nr:hypothetical protein PR048_019969 [Dryococelus australis]
MKKCNEIARRALLKCGNRRGLKYVNIGEKAEDGIEDGESVEDRSAEEMVEEDSQQAKPRNTKEEGKYFAKVAGFPWDHVYIDAVGTLLRIVSGFIHILVGVDSFTMFEFSFSVRSRTSA